MPLGIRQNNNFLHLTMDVWQDQIFFHETVYPAGHFAAELLNVPEETMREHSTVRRRYQPSGGDPGLGRAR